MCGSFMSFHFNFRFFSSKFFGGTKKISGQVKMMFVIFFRRPPRVGFFFETRWRSRKGQRVDSWAGKIHPTLMFFLTDSTIKITILNHHHHLGEDDFSLFPSIKQANLSHVGWYLLGNHGNVLSRFVVFTGG